MDSALGREASLGNTLEVRESIPSLKNPEFRVTRVPREGRADLMGRQESGGARQEGVQTFL